jgi:hypothetical protein
MSTSVDIQALAESGLGIFTRSAAVAIGIPPTAVDHEARVGRIVGIQPGVYRSAGTPVTGDIALRAALAAAGPDAVVSHRSAAHDHGLPGGDPTISS